MHADMIGASLHDDKFVQHPYFMPVWLWRHLGIPSYYGSISNVDPFHWVLKQGIPVRKTYRQRKSRGLLCIG